VTVYEMVTAFALHWFAVERVDVAVLEVGLGGRLDATNIVDAAVSVLTSISLDHTHVLGDTLEAIAREKADIIKRGHPCVSAPQPDEAMAVIRRVARERDARLYVGGSEGARWRKRADGGWDLDTDMGPLHNVRLALRGGFQRINAAVAVVALEALASQGVARLNLDGRRAGLEAVQWAGRFELVPGEPSVILDGAHNVESACRLREAFEEERPGRTPVLVLGIAADKDIPGIVGALCSAGKSPGPGLVVATRADHPRAAAAEAIAGAVQDRGVPVVVAPRVSEALAVALQRAEPTDDVVVTGSLHVVAEAREALGLAQASGERALDPWAIPS
jgi:dihydrofolate synthase/folylpolyglutamate synthase